MYLWHKLDGNRVDLELAGRAGSITQLKQKYDTYLPRDIQIVLAGKSCAFRIEVPSLDLFKEFNEQESAARQGLKAAYLLLCISEIIHNS
jgi:hypothetical protein